MFEWPPSSYGILDKELFRSGSHSAAERSPRRVSRPSEITWLINWRVRSRLGRAGESYGRLSTMELHGCTEYALQQRIVEILSSRMLYCRAILSILER